MGALEIFLLAAGGIVFVLSFLIPAGKGEADADTKELVQGEVKDMVAKELDGVKGRIEDIVDETVTYAMEKTERSLERVSNEKIMAVNEYSDTVLEDINKNHKEVMFLYDMLNDKHQNIKTTVSQVEKTVKEVEQTAREAVKEVEAVREAEEVAKEEKILNETDNLESASIKKEETKQDEADFVMLMPQKVSAAKAIKTKVPAKSTAPETPELDISFMKEGRKNGNNNERILEMHSAGKSNVAIAKALGLGVGEVKLVIDLFEGM